jgi:ArsR family transcriptional regulator
VPPASEAYKRQASLVKALAHPTRLQILDILAEDEACVCHLTAVLNQRQPYVSQQLMILREAGLVTDRKDGVMVYYRLADPVVTEAVQATRALLRANGEAVEFPPIPASPVEGCPCPHCGGEGPCV